MAEKQYYRNLTMGEPLIKGDMIYVCEHNNWQIITKKAEGMIWSPDIPPTQRRFTLPKNQKPKDRKPDAPKKEYDLRKFKKKTKLLITHRGDIRETEFDPKEMSKSKNFVKIHISQEEKPCYAKIDDLESRILELL